MSEFQLFDEVAKFNPVLFKKIFLDVTEIITDDYDKLQNLVDFLEKFYSEIYEMIITNPE